MQGDRRDLPMGVANLHPPKESLKKSNHTICALERSYTSWNRLSPTTPARTRRQIMRTGFLDREQIGWRKHSCRMQRVH